MKTFSLAVVCFGLALGFTAPCQAAILPGVVGTWKQISVSPLDVKADRPLWNELGLQDSEQAVYQSIPAKGTTTTSSLKVETWRVEDSTASLGAFEFLRPADAKPAPEFAELTPCAALTATGALVALGNYVIRFEGPVPQPDAVADMFRRMPRFERSPLPTFSTFLPPNQLANSQRYVGGPVALKQFLPGVESSSAGFRLGAEAAVADYPAGLRLGLFSYPTPSIARDREAALAKIPGALVKRTGPLVAIVLEPTNADAAENLLAQVRYQATVTIHEKPPSKKENPGNLLLNIFYLIVIVAGFCILSGVLFGLIRMAFRRVGPAGDGEEILTLHLEQR